MILWKYKISDNFSVLPKNYGFWGFSERISEEIEANVKIDMIKILMTSGMREIRVEV